MFDLGALGWSLIGGIGVLALLEVLLFWAAAALADAPEISWPKTFLVALAASALWAGAGAAITFVSGVPAVWNNPEYRPFALSVAGMCLAVSWIVPAVLYVPMLSISVPKSALISLFQMLLRAFLYALIIAFTMPFLAGLQIYNGTDVRTELRSTPVVLPAPQR
jgi:hypothetical protein